MSTRLWTTIRFVISRDLIGGYSIIVNSHSYSAVVYTVSTRCITTGPHNGQHYGVTHPGCLYIIAKTCQSQDHGECEETGNNDTFQTGLSGTS
jgi:hypothetical protein